MTRRHSPREAFEAWIMRNRPTTSLKYDESGAYIHPNLQVEWLAYAAGWAIRGIQP